MRIERSVKETARKAQRKDEVARRVLRRNCRSILCIVFRILKRFLKGEGSPAHLDNRTFMTRKSLEKTSCKIKSIDRKIVTSLRISN